MAVDLLGGIVVAGPLSLLAWRLRVVTGTGAIAGFVCAVSVYLGAYLAGIAVLGTALVLTVVSSRIGLRRKVVLGIAEANSGLRGAANVFANCGVGAAAGAVAALSSEWSGEAGAIVLVTAIAAGASDTVASEVGKAFSAQPRAFPTLRPVSAGTPGAVSVVGTVAGLVSATVIASPAVILWLLPADRIPSIVVACTVAAFVESALATRFEMKAGLGNNALNLINTATAATIALAWSAT